MTQALLPGEIPVVSRANADWSGPFNGDAEASDLGFPVDRNQWPNMAYVECRDGVTRLFGREAWLNGGQGAVYTCLAHEDEDDMVITQYRFSVYND